MCFCSVSTHLSTVRDMINIFSIETNLVKDVYHIGSFRGYGAMLDDG